MKKKKKKKEEKKTERGRNPIIVRQWKAEERFPISETRNFNRDSVPLDKLEIHTEIESENDERLILIR